MWEQTSFPIEMFTWLGQFWEFACFSEYYAALLVLLDF